jgi:uncharacterized protein DUF4177
VPEGEGVRWQYRVVNVGMFNAPERLTNILGELGADGWELVHVYDKASNWFANMEKGLAIFKRPVPASEKPDGPWASWTRAPIGGSREALSADGGVPIVDSPLVALHEKWGDLAFDVWAEYQELPFHERAVPADEPNPRR